MADDSLRILRVVQSTYPEVVGGVGLHVHQMSRGQAEKGHDVTVLTTDNGDRALLRREERDGYTLIRHREFARPLDNSIAPGVLKSLRKYAPEADVVHVHSHLYFMSNLAAAYEVLSDTPMVLTNHGLVSQTAPMPVQKAFIPTVGRFTFEAADRILCYTEKDRERLRERGIGTEISVVHNGIDCERFKPNGSNREKQLLFVGRLKPGKGVKHLLSAFGKIAEEYPEWELKLIGDGPLEEDFHKQVVDLDVDDRVTFIGEIPNEQMPEMYNKSKAFVLPSLNEGLPRTVLEAMACETPVVTSSLSQLLPLVEGSGYTVEPGSVEDLVQTLTKVIQADDLESLGTRGRERVTNEYSWKNTVDRTVEEYNSLINESRI